jgi:hypothetical protein
VTARQFRLALLGVGLLDAVDAHIASLPRAVQLEWEYAGVVERSNALIQGAASQFGLSPEQLDQLFVGAAEL